MRRAVVPLLLSMVAGCDMFDSELYKEAASAQLTSDSCVEADVPLLRPSASFVQLTLDALVDDWQVANCGAQRATGNDAFFAVDLDAGEKLHVHVNAIDDIDPVVYIVDSCDERVCQPLNAANHCPSGKEHLSFLAPRASRYFVGVDSVDPGGGHVEVLAVVPRCGDGEKEHSEACEDGNQRAGDGCDARCRIEIEASDRTELEPNDDLSGGNVLAVAESSSFNVRGRLEGPCDPEVFTFDVPSDRTATFRVLDGSGEACLAPSPGTGMALTVHEGLVEIARAVPDEEGCIVLEGIALEERDEVGAKPIASTTYHAQLRALPFDEIVPVEYTLAIDLD